MRTRALSLAVVVCALPLAAGCGGKGGDGTPKPTTPSGTPDAGAAKAAQSYLDAYVARDAKAVCAALAAKVRKQLADDKGTCAKTVKASFEGSYPKLEVKQALADGETAVALVAGQTRQVALERSGGAWLVTDGGQ